MSDGTYGFGQDQIDPFFREKRSWSKVKDEIVSKYVACYLKTVHKLNQQIVIVDAFSGPGTFGDGSDGSPLLICKAITDLVAGRQSAKCVFSDTRRAHRVQLEHNLAPFVKAGLCGAPFTECSEAIAYAIDTYRNSTIFFYLDPFGIKDIDFDMIRQIFQRNPSRSTEVLINFNFRTFMRMSGNWTYAASAQEVAEKVKASKVETVNQAMGGDYWQAIVMDPNLNKLDREDAVVQAYLSQLKKHVRFAFATPVKERMSDQLSVPLDELAHYHLIFGTRSPKAVEYMNDVALNALEPYLSQFTDGLLFDLTPDRYKPAAKHDVKEFIVSSVQARGRLRRPEIYDLVVPAYFRQYRLKDYRGMIDELVFTERRLFPDASSMKRANQLNDTVSLSAESDQSRLFG